MGRRPATDFAPLIVAHRRYPDESCVAFSDLPGFFWAVSPKGLRLRDSETRLVREYPTWQHAAADLMTLGFGPESGFGVVAAERGR